MYLAQELCSLKYRIVPYYHLNENEKCSCANDSCKFPGNHSMLPIKDEVVKCFTNEGEVRNFWSKHPEANLALFIDDKPVLVSPDHIDEILASLNPYDRPSTIKDNNNINSYTDRVDPLDKPDKAKTVIAEKIDTIC